jgi:hypothetical protein
MMIVSWWRLPGGIPQKESLFLKKNLRIIKNAIS